MGRKKGYCGHYGNRPKAICPRCGKTHVARVFWTGKGKPRIYCQPCRLLVGRVCNLRHKLYGGRDGD